MNEKENFLLLFTKLADTDGEEDRKEMYSPAERKEEREEEPHSFSPFDASECVKHHKPGSLLRPESRVGSRWGEGERERERDR